MKKFLEWIRRFFGKSTQATTNPTPVLTPVGHVPTFHETFKDLSSWIVSTWAAPGRDHSHDAKFTAEHVTVGPGGLRLKLTQSGDRTKAFSLGGEIATKQKFGYGKYEFVVRASSTAASPTALGAPVSGSITGIFNYGQDSITEIDFEMEGLAERCKYTQCTSWKGATNPNEHHKVSADGPLPHERFSKYTFIWSPAKIEYFRDDVLIATHTTVVPSEPCPIMLNHWGTNNPNWGGGVTPGVERFMYIKSVTFTPL